MDQIVDVIFHPSEITFPSRQRNITLKVLRQLLKLIVCIKAEERLQTPYKNDFINPSTLLCRKDPLFKVQ